MTTQVLPNTKNDLIVAAVQKNLIESAVIASLVRDVSGFAGKGTKSIAIPKLTNFAVQNRAFGNTGNATALVDSTDIINLNFNAYVAYLYDSRDNYQSTIEYQIEAALRASRAHAKYVDQQVIAGLVAAAEHEVTESNVKDDILEMRELLLNDGAEISQMALCISPEKEKEILSVADFVRADFYGSANVRTGQIGQLYGVPVVISRLLSASSTKMMMFDRDGFGLAFQGGVEMSEQMANEFGANSKRVAIDQVFGVGGLQLGEQGADPAKSPLIAKLV
jgi:hypothetical protein